MPKANSIRLVKSRSSEYAVDQAEIQRLVSLLCASGGDLKKHSQVLLVLLDALDHPLTKDTAIHFAKQAAFSQIIQEDSELLDAQIQLLKTEI